MKTITFISFQTKILPLQLVVTQEFCDALENYDKFSP